MSNWLPYAFKWDFLKSDFLKTVEAKVNILAYYVQSDDTLAINQFQRSMFTFDLSAKVAHIGVQSTY